MSFRPLRIVRIVLFWSFSIFSISALAQNHAVFDIHVLHTKTYVNHLYLADLNGDGVPDLIETYSVLTPNGFSVRLGKGDGSFATGVTHIFPLQNQGPVFLTTADVNRDGKTDVIVAINPDTTSPQGTLLVYLGKGNGTFAAPKSKNMASSIHALDRADFNHDGKVDLAVDLVDSTAGERVALMYGNGFGGFSAPFRIIPIATDHAVRSLAIGDFDADSHADIAVGVVNPPCQDPGYCASTNVYIAYGNGSGSFTKKLVFSEVPGIFTFTSGDLNLDGRTDLEGIFQDSSNVAHNVVILYGQKSRTVTSAYLTAPNFFSPGLTGVVADLNGDGKNDFATFGYDDQGNWSLDLFLGNADGTLTAQQLEITSGFVSNSQYVVGDFNRDGKPDLLFAGTQGPGSGPFVRDSTSLWEHLNVTSGDSFPTCAFPQPAAGIHICQPASGSPAASPVRFTVTADWFEPVRKLELWVDGTKLAQQQNGWDKYAWLDFKHSLASGSHRADIFSAGYDNALQHKSVTFTVP